MNTQTFNPLVSSQTKTLEGTLDKVTFFSEETGFAILRVKVRGHCDSITILGNLPTANPGESIAATGHWVRDKQHGLQFKASTLSSNPPTSLEGIERYLGSGLIKGIGPTLAKKLVKRFGDQVFDIIDNHSAKLQEVADVGPKRRQRIKAAWLEQKAIREIMVFLYSHGASGTRATRIYKTYGDDAIDIVRSNPYRLAQEISGIGFKIADGIAAKLGYTSNLPARLLSGIQHVLHLATNEGHCALPENQLIETSIQLLNETSDSISSAIDPMKLEEVLQKAVDKNELIKESIDNQLLIYLPKFYFAEKAIAKKIIDLTQSKSNYPAFNLEQEIIGYEKTKSRQLSASQKRALSQAFESRIFILTGGPGVGKTTLLDAILTILTTKGVKCILAAPTGRAAQRLSETTGLLAKTIHRLLQFRGVNSAQPTKGESQNFGFARNDKQPLEGDLIVIDECSMVDISLFNALLKALPSNAHLMLVGDVDQLPSVGPGSVLRHLIESDIVPTVRLTEIFRQAATSQIIVNAHRLNQGEMIPTSPQEKSSQESDFYFIERDDPQRILQTVCELVKHKIPAKWGLDPLRDIQILSPTHRGPIGARALNAELQNAINPVRFGEPAIDRFGWQFRIRDRVIQTINNYDKEVFNGDLGVIHSIDLNEGELKIKFDTGDRIVNYAFSELDEIAPAQAITIHKSQGSEFPAVVIPIAMSQFIMLQRNLFYTAMTRGKKLVVFVGQSKALNHAIQQLSDKKRYSGLLSRMLALNSNMS